jgi:hypothetical protein
VSDRATGSAGPDLDRWTEILPDDDSEDAIRLDDARDLLALVAVTAALLVVSGWLAISVWF